MRPPPSTACSSWTWAAAQRLLRMGSRTLTRVDLVATDDEVERVAAALLPPGARVVPARAQAGTVAQLTEAFQLNLTALSLLALVVGMFLIYNTVMFSVVQRRAVIGTLRLLGVTGEQVFALVLLETAAASALGVVLGLGLGWVLGQGAVRLVTQTINDLYYVLSVTGAPAHRGVRGEGGGPRPRRRCPGRGGPGARGRSGGAGRGPASQRLRVRDAADPPLGRSGRRRPRRPRWSAAPAGRALARPELRRPLRHRPRPGPGRAGGHRRGDGGGRPARRPRSSAPWGASRPAPSPARSAAPAWRSPPSRWRSRSRSGSA